MLFTLGCVVFISTTTRSGENELTENELTLIAPCQKAELKSARCSAQLALPLLLPTNRAGQFSLSCIPRFVNTNIDT